MGESISSSETGRSYGRVRGNASYHRMAVAIEDAGFEIRDMVNWVYGCLSEDTNIVGIDGVPVLYKSIKPNDKVLCYDKYTKEFFYSEVEEVYEYNIKDTCYRIQSDSTDQIVSRNHRCLVERGGEEVFVFAENLQEKENVPVLEDMYLLHETISNLHKGTGQEKLNMFERMCGEINFFSKNWKNKTFGSTVSYESLLFGLWKGVCSKYETLEKSFRFGMQFSLQWCYSWRGVEETCSQGSSMLERRVRNSIKGKNDWQHKSRMEGWSDLSSKSWKSQRGEVCSLPERISGYGEKGRLCDGTSSTCSEGNRPLFDKRRSGSSYKSRFAGQQNREPNVVQDEWGSQGIRGWSGHKTTLATVILLSMKERFGV